MAGLCPRRLLSDMKNRLLKQEESLTSLSFHCSRLSWGLHDDNTTLREASVVRIAG